jgi:2-oxoisovalerate dehydrogenase E1 component
MELIKLFTEEIKLAYYIRLVENRLIELYSQNKLNGTVHTCVGQEFSGVFINKYLNDNDYIVSNHRCHGHYISRFKDTYSLLAEIIGKTSGCSGGKGGSQHLVGKNFLSNGIQGGMLPIACGIGLNFKLNNQNNIAVAFIGDGTLGEGIVYETMNLCGIWQIPLLIVIENNSYAQSTSFNQTFSGDLQKRIEGFGLKYFKSSTFDLNLLDSAAKESIDYVRDNKCAAIVEIETYRLNSHSKGDDNRNLEEVELYKSKDLLNQLIKKNPEYFDELEVKIQQELDEIINKINLEKHIQISPNNEILNIKKKYDNSLHLLKKESPFYNELIYEALNNCLENNDSSIIIGEDIEYSTSFCPLPYGGAFKVTKDLSEKFPGRVSNTPISEAAITGVGIGYSIFNKYTFVEIMFGDFITLSFDQILQHASKFNYIYNDKVNCPIIIRTPMGGKRGYGPTHSQSLEKHFLGIPNINVVALNHRLNPISIYTNIVKNYNDPFIIIENKILYTRKFESKQMAGYNYTYSNNILPTLHIKPKSKNEDIVIFCYGDTLHDIELSIKEIFIEEEIICSIFCEALISQINTDFILEHLHSESKILIIEEGNNYSAWSSELISNLIENKVKIKALRRLSNNSIIPSDFESEINILPSVRKIKEEINILFEM